MIPRLPVLGMTQSVQGSKIEARNGIQRLSEPSERRGVFADLFPDRAYDGTNAGRLGVSPFSENSVKVLRNV
jgi:hypothetical protein